MAPDLFTLLLAVLPPAPLPQTVGAAAPDAPPRAFRPQLELRDFELTAPTFVFSQQPGVTVGPRQLVLASEWTMGADLNGDGDQNDDVLESVDLRTGVLTNLGLAVFNQFALDPAQPDHVLVLQSEAMQGNQDLNGDGDHSDRVMIDVNLATGSSRSSGLANLVSSAAHVSGHWAALNVSEAGEGSGDLNGDGILGNALFRWNLSGPGAPVVVPINLGSIQAAHESYFLFTVQESVGGADLNGDGDTNDQVLHALHGPTGNITNSGLAGTAIARGPYSVLTVSESSQGQDLNGDGDQLDLVPHTFSLLTGQVVNMGVNWSQVVVDTGKSLERVAREYAISDSGYAFHVSEPGQGGVDLNGDGDATDDDVLFVHLFATGETRNLGLSVFDYELGDGLLAMQVGKYDASLMAEIHDLAQNTTWNLGIPSFQAVSPTSFRIHGDWVAVVANEGTTVDHTGDGMGFDDYLVLANERHHQMIDTGMALSRTNAVEFSLVFHDTGMLTALARELDMAIDLNGDGDITDEVVRLFQPDLGFELDTGQGAFLLTPGYRQNYPFIAKESEDVADHNGDGDAQDVVLRQARLKLR